MSEGVLHVSMFSANATDAGCVMFAAPHVVTLPDGSKVSIPAGSTAVEVTAKEAADHAAAVSWATNECENDNRRVEAMRQMEHRQTRRLIEGMRAALAMAVTDDVVDHDLNRAVADADAWLAANDGDPMCGALPTPTGWDPVGGRPTYGETVEVHEDRSPAASFAGIASPIATRGVVFTHRCVIDTPNGPRQIGGSPDAPRGILSTVEGATHGEPQGLTAEAVWPSPGVRQPVEDDGA